MEVRCRHCCKSLFKSDSILLNAHCEVKQRTTDVECQGDESDCCSYMTPENVPDWIMDAIDQVYLIKILKMRTYKCIRYKSRDYILKESWTKGKLHCPYCNSRLGSFNFVNELKCYCDKYIKPPIRIVNSKVDILYERQ